MVEYDVFGVGSIVNIKTIDIDEGVDVLNTGCVEGDGAVVDDVSVEGAILEGVESADEDARWIGEHGENWSPGILEFVGCPELLAGDGEGAGAKIVEEVVMPAEQGSAGTEMWCCEGCEVLCLSVRKPRLCGRARMRLPTTGSMRSK